VIDGARVSDRGLALWKLRLMAMMPKREVVIRRDEIIPAEAWEGLSSVPAITAAHRSIAEDDTTAVMYVLVAPSHGGMRGYGWPTGDDPLSLRHPELMIFSEALKPILWLSRSQQEVAVLTHETGHVLGLVSEGDHQDRVHCTHGECLMHDGISAASVFAMGPTILTGRFPGRFCHACMADLYGPDGLTPAERADRDRSLP
jgi:hypothetical protein